MKVSVNQNTIKIQNNPIWGLDRIVPPLNWKYSYKYTGRGVAVFILDTGLRTTHEEFGNRAYCGATYYGNDCIDYVGHGTHVAGTIGGELYGVAKGVTLVAVKIFNNIGEGSNDGILAGLDWVIQQKKSNPNTPMVINMSLGGPKSTYINNAVNAAVNAKIVSVVAAGNESKDACYVSPASTSNAITVGATTFDNIRSSFSNYGRCIDILAPGSDIISASHMSDNTLRVLSGTSMATPHVAGVVALYLHRKSSLSPSAVWNLMRSDSSRNIIKFPSIGGSTDLTPNLFLNLTNLLK